MNKATSSLGTVTYQKKAKTRQNKKNPYHIREENQNRKTKIILRRKKKNRAAPTHCGEKRGEQQHHQTQQCDEEEPGSTIARRTPPEKKITHEPKTRQEAHRDIAPEQEQIGNKQSHLEMNTTR